VAHLSVSDFDRRTGELKIGKDKSGRDRRILVPDAAAALFGDQSKDKLADSAALHAANRRPGISTPGSIRSNGRRSRLFCRQEPPHTRFGTRPSPTW
jgi:hypothetical protein